MRCKGLCGKPATVHLKYTKLNLCDNHFIEFELNRMVRTIRRFKLISASRDKIIVALSGGKDSAALLDMLVTHYNRIELKYRPKIEALHLDLGIQDNSYSKKSHEKAEYLCKLLEIPFHYIDLKKEYDFTLSEIRKDHPDKLRKICSVCGLIKRYILNRISWELGGTKVATGQLSDDEVSNLMKNLLYNPNELLIRMSAYLESKNDFKMVSRIKPLYEITEFETSQYVKIKNLPYILDKCPYSPKKSMKMKDVMNYLESKFPNSRYNLMRNFIKYYQPAFKTSIEFKETNIDKCKKCGFPTTIEICSFCRLLEKIRSIKEI